MPITIVKEKKQQKRTEAVAEALAQLGELVAFQKLSKKVEKGLATPAEKRSYKKAKPRKMWSAAAKRHAKASAAVATNGSIHKPTRTQSARKAWATRRAV